MYYNINNKKQIEINFDYIVDYMECSIGTL